MISATSPRVGTFSSFVAAKTAKAWVARRSPKASSTGLGADWHGTTPDGELTVEPVYCLGHCASSPSALLDGEPLARLNAATLADAIEEARGL